MQAVRIGFVGAGRLGQALALALQREGQPVAAVASARAASAQAMAAALGCRAVDAQAVVNACDLVFVTTPDAAIAPVVRALRWRPGVAVVHCSGATDVDEALGPAAAQGAGVGGFHPMQTFADPEAAARSLRGCTVTVEARDPALDATLVGLADALGCPVNRLPPGMRALPRRGGLRLAVHQRAAGRRRARVVQLGASEADAARALLPLARGTLAAIERAGIAGGMPGPVSRGDVHTVAQHAQALAGCEGDTLDSYRLLCRRTVQLALQRGAIDGVTAAKVRAMLR